MLRVFVAAVLLALSARMRAQSGAPIALDDARQVEIGKMLERALSEKDPNEQIRIYKDLLRLDPSNQNAFNGIRAAQQRVESEANLANEKERQRRKEQEAESARANQEQRALTDADTAIQNGDVDGARIALDSARKLGGSNPAIAGLETRLHDLFDYKRKLRYAAYGAAVVVVGMLVAMVFAFGGRKTAYIEIVDGLEAGKRDSIDKDILLIGSVQNYEGGTNDIVITDSDGMISECQCEIHRNEGKHYIVDCDSAYGTTADGCRVTADRPVRLRHGSMIDLGGVRTLRFGLEKKR